MAIDPVLQELADRAAIRDVMIRYARGLDRRDFDMVRSCFTSDAYADYRGRAASGIDNIVRNLSRIDRFQGTTHFMGDQLIDIQGDTADVETYAIDYLLYTLEGTQYMSTGGLRYNDKFMRQDGKWLVHHRVMYVDWRRNEPIDQASPGPDSV
jgi:hypothetical protein